MVNKECFDFLNPGNFSSAKKLISLPTHFTFKEDKELDDFISILNDKFKEIDFKNHKDLFKITPKELEFAILFEIYKSKYDIRLIDSFAVSLSALSSTNFAVLAKSKTKFFSISSLLFLILLYVYFTNRTAFLEAYALSKMLDHDDFKLFEAGLKYLNKQIQLGKLLGRDVEQLVNQLKEVKTRFDELKKSDYKTDFKYENKLEKRLQAIRDKSLKEMINHLKSFKMS